MVPVRTSDVLHKDAYEELCSALETAWLEVETRQEVWCNELLHSSIS